MELAKKYDPQIEEPNILKFWENNVIYKFDPDSDKPLFVIDTPPPTVSGEMHMVMHSVMLNKILLQDTKE